MRAARFEKEKILFEESSVIGKRGEAFPDSTR